MKINEIRKDNGKDKKMVAMFFNSMFLSIDSKPYDDEDLVYQIPDKSDPYNMGMLNIYLIFYMMIVLMLNVIIMKKLQYIIY